MGKVKMGQNVNLILIIIFAICGVALWVIATAVLALQVLSGNLNEELAQIAAIVIQGVVACVVALLSRCTSGAKGIVQSLITLVTYLVIQVVLSLLFWGVDAIGLLRNCVVIAGGAVVSFIVYGLRNKPKKEMNLRKLYR